MNRFENAGQEALSQSSAGSRPPLLLAVNPVHRDVHEIPQFSPGLLLSSIGTDRVVCLDREGKVKEIFGEPGLERLRDIPKSRFARISDLVPSGIAACLWYESYCVIRFRLQRFCHRAGIC